MVNVAYAMGQGAHGAQGGSGYSAFIPIILMFVIFYFLLIRPQQKKTKDHQRMIASLKKGDRVITNGGIYGQIISLDENSAMVEVADKVRIRVTRASIAGLSPESGKAAKKNE